MPIAGLLDRRPRGLLGAAVAVFVAAHLVVAPAPAWAAEDGEPDFLVFGVG